MGAARPRRIPLSSYRLQLGPHLSLFDAAQLLAYMEALGVTECYLSPILTARPGSPHGYDVCDHASINPEFGGEQGLATFAAAARARNIGILLDFVPNHMSTHPRANRWWRSVLENGPSSPFAGHFDIDWEPVKIELRDKLLLPVLGDQYGVTLDSGSLRLELADAEFRLRYGDLDLPLNPRRLRMLLEHRIEDLTRDMPPGDAEMTEYLSILFHLEHLPPYTATEAAQVAERQREKEVALGRLATLLHRAPRVRAHVEENVRRFNGVPEDPASFDLLHALLEAQPYRLASWRTATHEINYRRFFDINDLAGIRMEDPAVFAAAHARLAGLIDDGTISGVRLDHVDGLFDPDQYLHQLAALGGSAGPLWTVVEKILETEERLNADWEVHGTTGYDFLNSVNGLFVDAARAATFAAVYAAFVGERQAFSDVEYDSKKVIISSSMASELNVLAHELNRISESHRRFRDFTLDSLQEALREVVACFPVYRTYFRGLPPTAFDNASVDRAIALALRRNPALEATIFRFVRQMLLPEAGAAAGSDVTEAEYARRRRFAMKFQQYTAPVHAKGVEDTAFYRSCMLVSLNEVGGDPTRFGRSVDEFHADNQARQSQWPLSLLATATHDTKRGEDARARINVLSEMPRDWRAAIGRWSRITATVRRTVHEHPAPSPNEEHLYYQALLGAWPPGARRKPGSEFVERFCEFMLKAIREAKVHTSWVNPAVEHETAVLDFVRETLSGSVSGRFVRSFASFATPVVFFGVLNSLAQLVLKLTSPGVPDIYGGTELWDLSLVDPDNRRPVDFSQRQRLLTGVRELAARARAKECVADVRDLMEHWTDARIKLYVTHAGLALRRRHASLFVDGAYVPLRANGERNEHVVSFARLLGGEAVLVLVPRLVVALTGSRAALPVARAVWGDTSLVIPNDVPRGMYRNVLTGEVLAVHNSVLVGDILTTLPVGLWHGPHEA